MLIAKGQVMNPYGGQNKAGRRALTKLRLALDSAIDLLGDTSRDGVTVLAGKIKDKLSEDPIGTLKALMPLLPKDIDVSVQHTGNPSQLSDQEIADEIAHRARARLEQARDITDITDITVVEEVHPQSQHSNAPCSTTKA